MPTHRPKLSWKDIFTNRDRRQFPEVVVPLPDSRAPHNLPIPEPNADAEKKPDADDTSNASIDKASSQENGVGAPPPYTSSSMEALRAQVDSEISISGHDSVYDRMCILSTLGVLA